ncbi:hypothetical protein BDK51DRAFT_43516 [Blyttiomyces helicus]|uniref:Uncharacterized protein n=1 Tax=Blyttiomyces helicus TaxID=388810 RepID=A0A4P9WJD8_9FUNG|nr:hypothetical protein BDK51DRAFT_43516 [Blyttiomyces helicus]|eukprot:RKO92053.1 hypothetical protein BDK51DRAFT_43516 [Blyttiomyces helicus]
MNDDDVEDEDDVDEEPQQAWLPDSEVNESGMEVEPVPLPSGPVLLLSRGERRSSRLWTRWRVGLRGTFPPRVESRDRISDPAKERAAAAAAATPPSPSDPPRRRSLLATITITPPSPCVTIGYYLSLPISPSALKGSAPPTWRGEKRRSTLQSGASMRLRGLVHPPPLDPHRGAPRGRTQPSPQLHNFNRVDLLDLHPRPNHDHDLALTPTLHRPDLRAWCPGAYNAPPRAPRSLTPSRAPTWIRRGCWRPRVTGVRETSARDRVQCAKGA